LTKIQFFSTNSFRFPHKRKARELILFIFKNEKKTFLHLNFIFCSDEELLVLNRKHLDHNDYTDILTFDLSVNNHEIISEIYISTDRVCENAFIFNVPFLQELFRVIIHGSLHLCGYGDKKKSEILVMRQKEARYLRFIEK